MTVFLRAIPVENQNPADKIVPVPLEMSAPDQLMETLCILNPLLTDKERAAGYGTDAVIALATRAMSLLAQTQKELKEVLALTT